MMGIVFETPQPWREALEAIAKTRVSPACARIAQAALDLVPATTPPEEMEAEGDSGSAPLPEPIGLSAGSDQNDRGEGGAAWEQRSVNTENALSKLAKAARRVMDARDAWTSPDRGRHPSLMREEAEAWIELRAVFDTTSPSPPLATVLHEPNPPGGDEGKSVAATPENIEAARIAAKPYQDAFKAGYEARELEWQNAPGGDEGLVEDVAEVIWNGTGGVRHGGPFKYFPKGTVARDQMEGMAKDILSIPRLADALSSRPASGVGEET